MEKKGLEDKPGKGGEMGSSCLAWPPGPGGEPLETLTSVARDRGLLSHGSVGLLPWAFFSALHTTLCSLQGSGAVE